MPKRSGLFAMLQAVQPVPKRAEGAWRSKSRWIGVSEKPEVRDLVKERVARLNGEPYGQFKFVVDSELVGFSNVRCARLGE